MSLYTKIIDLQKLNTAWKKVRANKPAAGIDDITWEMYDAESVQENKILNRELSEHDYKCKPVKTVILYKNNKERPIALYCMRDKVVQQSIAEELNKTYNPLFSSQTYAYRSNKSALAASEEIERQIHTGRYAWVLKVDIQKFFDSIRWDILEKILRIRNSEDDVIELMRDSACAPTVDQEGNLNPKRVGIHQGSSIAPVLSNIYLMDFDKWMSCQGVYFVRYSDDLLILGKEKNRLQELLSQIQTRFESIGLTLSEKKTVLCSLEEGVEFLGFSFDKSGKCISSKAEEQLGSRLESVWLLNRNKGVQERLRKMSEVLNGWEQYFRGNRKPADILEYATVIYMVRNKEQVKKLLELRTGYTNIYPDILRYLLKIWEENERIDLCLFEYEQYYGFYQTDRNSALNTGDIRSLLEKYRALLENEIKENYVDLMQSYADLHLYEHASAVADKIAILESRGERGLQIDTMLVKEHDSGSDVQLCYSEDDIEQYMNLFVGREDIFAVVDFLGGRKQISMKMQPLTKALVKEHLSGEYVLATYIQRQNATVKYMVLDVDVSRKILIECKGDREKIYPYLKDAAEATAEIGKWFRSRGITVRYEFSGGRGYHIWLFFESWIPTYYANMLQDILEKEFIDRFGTELTLEFFPNKTRLKNGKIGQCIKLPLSINRESSIRSILLDDDFCETDRLKDWIQNTPRYSLNVLKKVVASSSTSLDEKPLKMTNSDLSPFGDLDANISKILEKCNLMRYLCRKAYDTGYLTHFERLSVLYVYGHVGEEGKRFVHQIMEYTINYKYNVTEKFIRKCPEKPISCMKLRDQYKSVTAEIGCSCVFRRNDKCYPSPVLHAISSSNDQSTDVTLPTSRTLSAEKSKHVADEMNIHKRAQMLASRILELKKQRRGIDSSVRKIEKELERLFDEEKIDSLELEIGLLVRRKKEAGYEWLIEI